ncbi:MAG: hypothetical protein NTU80_11675, partial [Verrucomicrobia bacterium]|nr:hypothetical protein [Verrucomicrobiota bacterium]
MKHITFLWIGLCILTRLTLWAGGAASTSSNNGQTINTLAGSSYAIVRLAEPTSPAGLTPIRLTNSAYVLLKNRDNKAGYVWQNGQLTALTAPPFDTQSGDAWEALDINERGEVVGFTDLGYILDLEYWNFHNAVYWASPLANPRFLKPATEFKNAFPPWNGDYLIDDSFAECIDNNGVIYGKTYQLYANNSHGVSDISMVDGVRWDSADSDATRLGNGFDYVTSENRFDLGSVKYKIVKLKGGGVKTYKSVHVTDFNWDGYVIYAGIT